MVRNTLPAQARREQYPIKKSRLITCAFIRKRDREESTICFQIQMRNTQLADHKQKNILKKTPVVNHNVA